MVTVEIMMAANIADINIIIAIIIIILITFISCRRFCVLTGRSIWALKVSFGPGMRLQDCVVVRQN